MIGQRRPDGSFVLNGGTYHVPNEGEFKEEWEILNKAWLEAPEEFEQLEDFLDHSDMAKQREAEAAAAAESQTD